LSKQLILKSTLVIHNDSVVNLQIEPKGGLVTWQDESSRMYICLILA